MPAFSRLPALALAAVGFFMATAIVLLPADAQQRTSRDQELLPVDWGNAEIASRSSLESRGGLNEAALSKLEIPVLAFTQTPQLVRNILGNGAKPLKPRVLISDPKQPFWYQIEDNYEGISISIEADRRVNQRVSKDFQIGERRSGAEATLGTKAKPKISVLDGTTEEGMVGVILSYTLSKFPDIPYTVTIECTGENRLKCKDVATIAKDQALLQVISAQRR